MSAHAWFAASAATRWMKCGASVVIDTSGLVEESKPAADRGSWLHNVCHKLTTQHWTGGILFNDLSPDDREAVLAALEYESQLPGIKMYEIQSEFIPHCGGTSDVVSIDAEYNVLHIADYKFGRWPVSPVENIQLSIYALGMLKWLEPLSYDFRRVVLHIIQPDGENFEEWPIEIADLLKVGEDIQVRVEGVIAGDAEFHPDPQTTCKWCPGKPICPALADYALRAAREQFADSPGVELRESSDLSHLDEENPLTWIQKMEVADLAEMWATSVRNSVKDMVMADPDSVPGFKVVQGRQSRDWHGDEGKKKAKAWLEGEGMTEQQIYSDPVFVSPAQADKLFRGKGSGAKKKEIETFVKRTPGPPTVVPVDDPRDEYNPTDVAKLQFDKVDVGE